MYGVERSEEGDSKSPGESEREMERKKKKKKKRERENKKREKKRPENRRSGTVLTGVGDVVGEQAAPYRV